MLTKTNTREIWPSYNLVMDLVQFPIGFIIDDGVRAITEEEVDANNN